MSTLGRQAVSPAALLWLLALIAGTAMAQSIDGTATYRERVALPPSAVFEATLEDVSRADAPSEMIAQTPCGLAGQSTHRVQPPVRSCQDTCWPSLRRSREDTPQRQAAVHQRRRDSGDHSWGPDQRLHTAAKGWRGTDAGVDTWGHDTYRRHVLESDRA